MLLGTEHTVSDTDLDSMFLILLLTQKGVHYLNRPATNCIILVVWVCNISQDLPTGDDYLQIICGKIDITCGSQAYGLDMATDSGFVQELNDSYVRIKQYRVIIWVNYDG